MSILRSARWLLLALVVTLIPATSHAGVYISVGFAPPPMPVYVQPDCPQPGLMWTPGYWAYDYDQQSYYWVDGAWVPAPYPGALWTPGYWGWEDGVYVFHPGYWGDHVGYYGGVDYGFGYDGIGYTGGEWRGGWFFYNTAITHVDRRYIHRTFEDRDRVDRGYVDWDHRDHGDHGWNHQDGRVAFSGGPGGIRYQPSAQERMAEHERHVGATSFQQQHESAARGSHGSNVRGGGAPSSQRGKSATDDWNAPTRTQAPANSGHGGKSASDDWTSQSLQRNSTGSNGGGATSGGGRDSSVNDHKNISDGAAKSQAVDGMAHNPNGGSQGQGEPMGIHRSIDTTSPGIAVKTEGEGVRGMAHGPTGGAGGGNGGFTRTYNASHSNTGNAPSHPQPQSRPQSHPAPQPHESHGNSGGHKDEHGHR